MKIFDRYGIDTPVTLQSSYTSGGSSLSVNAVPSGVGASDVWHLKVKAQGANTEEVFKVTATSGSGPYTLTVTGAQMNTSASNHASGAEVVGSVIGSATLAALTDAAIGMGFDGGGSAIALNSIGYVRAPFAGTITGWSIVVDTGTITIDVLSIANSDGGALPTSSITASATPAIASGNQHVSSTLTGWSTAIAANDVFGFKATAVSGATKAELRLTYTRS